MPQRQPMPLLREKLRVLEKRGGFDLEELGKELKRSENTLLSWGDGGTAAPDTVPAALYSKFITAIAKRLPDVSVDEVERLMTAPTSRGLEALFGVQELPTLLEALNAKATQGTVTLHRKTLGLIETESTVSQAKPEHNLKLGEFFHLKLRRDTSHRHILALQHGGRLWGTVPHSIDAETGHVHLPGVLEDSSPDFMRETTSGGTHWFFVIVCRKPIPERVTQAVADGVIETEQQKVIAAWVVGSDAAIDGVSVRVV